MSEEEPPKYGERVPSEKKEEPKANDWGWNEKNRVVVTDPLPLKRIAALNPFREDEAYISDRQVAIHRQILSAVNARDITMLLFGNMILSLFGMVVIFSALFGAIPYNGLTVAVASVGLFTPMLISRFNPTLRLWNKYARSLVTAIQISALAEAYRSRYNLVLSPKDKEEMLRSGAITAKDTDGVEYRVVAVGMFETGYSVIMKKE